MARVWCCVPNMIRFKYSDTNVGLGFTNGYNFEGDGYGFTARSNNYGSGGSIMDMPIGPSWDTNGTTFNYPSLYYFMRFRIKRLPTSSASFLEFYYRTTTLIEFHFDLNADGTMSVYNDAGTANLVTTIPAANLPLNTWLTMYGRLVGSTTTNNVGGASVIVGGVDIYNNFTPGALPGAGVGLNALAALPFYKVVPAFGVRVANVGCEADLDQLLCDDTDAITSASRFSRVLVTGNGAFTQYTSSAGTISNDWKYRNQNQSKMIDTGLSFPECQSTVAGNDSSWTTQTLRQAGITQGVKTAIIIHDTMNATNSRHFYTRNGGLQQFETTPVGAPAEDVTLSLRDASSWGLDDAIEIGVRCLGGVGRVGHIGLFIEHTTPFVAPTDGDVQIQRMNYTGNGAGVAGALAVTLPFEPTMLMIAARTGTADPVHVWHKKGGFITAFTDAPRRAAYVYGTTLILGNVDLNVNGTVYDVLCIKDYQQRMFGSDAFYQMNQTVPFDTDNEQVTTGLPAPFAVWSWIESDGFGNFDGFMMGPGQAADASLPFSPAAALTANIIQTLNATGFIYRRGRYVSADGLQYSNITFLPTGFDTTRLYDVFTYTGDGTANRVVPLTNFPANIPVWVMVFPHNNSARYMRNNQQSNALRLDTPATDASAIAGFAAGQFTVNGTTNTNAILYTVFVFIEGIDALASNQYSGIYYLDPAARHDTLWDRAGAPTATNVKIPNPIYRTHFVGDG